MGEVLLLDIGVVVLAIGPGPGEGQALLLGVPVELIVDEGVVVVRVDPPPPEGGPGADLLDGLEDPALGPDPSPPRPPTRRTRSPGPRGCGRIPRPSRPRSEGPGPSPGTRSESRSQSVIFSGIFLAMRFPPTLPYRFWAIHSVFFAVRRRSIVAEETRWSFGAVFSSTSSSPESPKPVQFLLDHGLQPLAARPIEDLPERLQGHPHRSPVDRLSLLPGPGSPPRTRPATFLRRGLAGHARITAIFVQNRAFPPLPGPADTVPRELSDTVRVIACPSCACHPIL